MKGKLTVITGPMFSGKTSELMRLYDRECIAKRASVIFKPGIDTRGLKNNITTHNDEKREAILIDNPLVMLDSLPYRKKIINVFIDEVQFFDERIIDTVYLFLYSGINVFCAGLNLDYKNEPWPYIGELLARADFIKKVTAICNVCGENATKTQRITKDKKDIIIGGKHKYEARCVEHYERP